MITPSYALTATERVLPKLALDFTTASLDPRVTFTRTGNTATVTNSSGYVVPINADLPRFDYDPVTLVCKGLLIEESRTNLQTYSSDFTNGVWTKAAVSVATNATTAPDGTVTSNKIVEDSTLANHRFYSGTLSLSGTNTASIYVKAAGRSYIQFGIWNSSSGIFDTAAVINLTDGTTSSVTGTITVTSAGDGWWRCTATGAYTTANRLYVRLLASASVVNYQGDGVSGVFAWGAQVEAGAFATSYIPTEASQVTRTADVATMTGTNFSDWFNASEGAFAVKANIYSLAGAFNMTYSANDGTANKTLSIRHAAANSTNIVSVVVDTTSQASMFCLTNLAANTDFVAATGYKADNFAAAGNGGAIATDLTGTVPAVNQLELGSQASTFYLNGWIKKLSYWPQRITNAEVQAFSK